MDSSRYHRRVELHCPVCGSTQFQSDDDPSVESVTCHSCDRETSKDELLSDNAENIEAHIGEIKKEVLNDAAKSLQKETNKIFRNSKFIKVR